MIYKGLSPCPPHRLLLARIFAARGSLWAGAFRRNEVDTTELCKHRRVGGIGGPDSYFHHVSGPQPSVQLASSTLVTSASLCSVQHGPGPGPQELYPEAAVPKSHQGTSYASPSASLFLPALPGHQERWPIPTSSGPLQVEQIPGCPSFQDGINTIHSLGHSGAHVGLHSGYAGRILPRANRGHFT